MKTRKTVVVGALSAMMLVAFCGGVMATQTASANTLEVDVNAFTMVEGASIRLRDPSGIRFITKIGETHYTELTKENSNQSLHMLIVPESYYEEAKTATNDGGSISEYLVENKTTLLNLTIPTEKIFQKSDLEDKAQEYYEDGYYYAHGVIQELNFNSYANDFVGIAYLKTTDGEYTDATITDETPARSAYEVALRAWNDYEDKTALKAVIDTSLYYKAGVREANGEYFVTNDITTKFDTFEAVKNSIGALSVSATVPEYIFAGENATINATLKAGETAVSGVEFSYASSTASVATVDENGKITAVGAGTAEITVTGAKNYFTTVTVNVINKDLLAQDMTSYWLARAQVGVEWDNTENAIKLTTYAPASSIHTGIYSLRLPMLNEYYKLGYRTFSFKVKVDEQALENGVSIGAHLMNPDWTSGSSFDVAAANAMSSTEYTTAIVNLDGNSLYEGQYNAGFSADGLLQFEIKGSTTVEKPSVLYLKEFYPVVVTKGNTTLNAGNNIDILQGLNDTLAPTLTVAGETVENAVFTYSSTNPNVVTVDENGQITSVTVGLAKILVSAPEYGVSNLVDITVTTSDLFAESMVNNWSPQIGISREWDATENALKVVSTCQQTNTSTSILYIALPFMRTYFEAGYVKFTFESKVDEKALANGVSIESLTLNPGWVSGCGHTLAVHSEMRADGYAKHTIDFTGAKIEQYFKSEEGLRDDGWFGIIVKNNATVSAENPSTLWLKNFQPIE